MWKADITVEFADGSSGAVVQDSYYRDSCMAYATKLVQAMVEDGYAGRAKEVIAHKITLRQEV